MRNYPILCPSPYLLVDFPQLSIKSLGIEKFPQTPHVLPFYLIRVNAIDWRRRNGDGSLRSISKIEYFILSGACTHAPLPSLSSHGYKTCCQTSQPLKTPEFGSTLPPPATPSVDSLYSGTTYTYRFYSLPTIHFLLSLLNSF